MRVFPKYNINVIPMTMLFVVGVLVVSSLPAFGSLGKALTIPALVAFCALILLADRMEVTDG